MYARQKLSLISCDDTELSALHNPPIAVIKRDLHEIGRTAAELLLQRLRGDTNSLPRRASIPTELVLRESCAAPPELLR